MSAVQPPGASHAAGGVAAPAKSFGAIKALTLHSVRITHKTCWTFVTLSTHAGLTGHGEATLTGREAALLEAAEHFAPAALAASITDPGSFSAAHAPSGLAQAAIVCAVDQALWDLHAQSLQQPLAQVLGTHRERISVYANINRRTEQRSPEGFAASALAAMADGFRAFKLAPFDEVSVEVCAQGQGAHAMQAGLARIAAVREAVGPGERLMVDCHWRFDEATARTLNHAAAGMGVHWIECPLPEVPANIPALARLRQHANALGMRQAGLEECTGWEAFRPYCEGGAYDVVMPDIKYAGGIAEMLRIAQACEQLGILVSPHNPSGPVCHAASLQFARAAVAFDMLELQYDESPLFHTLVQAAFAPIRDGQTHAPAGNGLAMRLDPAQLARHAQQPVRVWEAP